MRKLQIQDPDVMRIAIQQEIVVQVLLRRGDGCLFHANYNVHAFSSGQVWGGRLAGHVGRPRPSISPLIPSITWGG